MDTGKTEVVIVEDDPNDAELIVRIFRKRSLTGKLILLKDGAEALDFLFAQGSSAVPKVILLDLKLPKVNGIEVLQRLKSSDKTRNIPVVVLTSSSEERDLKDAYALGVNSYLAKPIQSEEFADLVAELGKYWLLLNKTPER